ncbi:MULTISPECIES: peptide ABC transporter substrate-binding protein [Agrobacterium]|jgi:peptide/nickel transport system substrate-binding protein|uniref:Peptide ABC transporter substrate-binding protein n=1 Tax=Agrobacterium tumefaciens TaxID=358 RepID=A0A1B9UIE0_AGRTU|nr:MULTISPECIES: peptide ABC transporter substrate-binding protein [Agrobacterium]EHJ95675.1 oligopeptide transport system substrate binding protein [Agrobacterium tumefaciens 5A]MDP9562300.1 peptide/nickel transport system substrate-binding protein [Rhizobium nepotum]AYM13762.1 peptide/nickel transport system substrate-binding protein [Agrobacterium tumefaciens]KAA3499616.1 peptide ABC transporter substrate-binding protein [Agrobacterium tumefaciens]KAA3522632.1 peptide ABC transporter substr
MKKRSVLFASTVAALAMAGSAAHAERGSDGELKILFWQAVSTLNPYLSAGTKEVYSSSMVIEPLARYDEKGELVPMLVSEIPTVDNGGIAKDLLSMTWKLKSDVKWSDGTPFTADDVIFTWKYCIAPDGGCAQAAQYEGVKNVEAIDAHTIKISFNEPKPYPYSAFVGAQSPVIQKKQFEKCVGAAAPGCTSANFGPIGTGPFVVKDFKPNDVISFVANPNYRDPAKPAFATATLKGGGDAASAARAVLETGEFDYAWNMQVEPEILATMVAAGKGKLETAFGTQVERINLNWYNADPALGDKRSTKEGGPHPALSDPAVRRALSLAIDRDIIDEAGYGEAGKPTCNIVPAPEAVASTKNDSWCLKQDLEGANKLLDDAGWVKGADGIRAKNGVKLSFLYQTSTNSVRQATQELVKDMWSQIGVASELRNVSASVFFGGDPASPDTFQKFFADVEMYTNNFDGTDPEKYLAEWLCDKIPAPANGWQGQNIPRYCNPEFDKLVGELSKTADPAKRGEISKQLNDMLTEEGAHIPLIHRGSVSSHSLTLEGVRMNAWDSELWNVADWSRKK